MTFEPWDLTPEDLNDYESYIPEQFKKEIKFIEMLVGVNKENLQSVFEQINKYNVNKALIIIKYSIDIRPLEIESFLTLISLITSKFGVDILPYYSSSYFRSLLESRGILPKQKYSYSNKENTEFATGSIEQAIREDNVEQFNELVSHPSFNAKKRIRLSSTYGDDSIINKCKSYMQLIVSFGAVKCCKQALMNSDFDLNDISKYVIAGGNIEIFHCFERKGISFDNCFETGVKFHRIEMCQWLLKNTECESISLSSSLEYFNYPVFFFTMLNNKSFDDALFAATKECNIDIIRYLVEQRNVDVNIKDEKGQTPLHFATESCNISIIKYFVEQGRADVNIKSNTNQTPLQIAINRDSIDIIKYLVEKGRADVNIISGYHEETLIHTAAWNSKTDIVKCLVEQGRGEVNIKNRLKKTPLYIATDNNDIEIIKCLVEKGRADVNIKCEDNEQTALLLAVNRGRTDAVKCLVEQGHANVNIKCGSYNQTALHLAAWRGSINIVKCLVEKGNANVCVKDRYGRTPIYNAVLQGHGDIAEYLIRQTLLYNAPKKYNIDIVNFLTEECHAPWPTVSRIAIFVAIEKEDLKFIKYLVEERQASVDVKNEDGQTPLDVATKKGNTDIINYLTERCKLIA
jgi:ankyrin repeat protein